MICPNCGKKNSKSKNVCVRCGTPLHEGTDMPGAGASAAMGGKKKGVRIVLTAIAVLLVLAAAAALFLILRPASASGFLERAAYVRCVTDSGDIGFIVDGKKAEGGNADREFLSGDGSALYYVEDDRLYCVSGGKTKRCAADIDACQVSYDGRYVYYTDSESTLFQYRKNGKSRMVVDGEEDYELLTVSPGGSCCVFGMENDGDCDVYLWKNGKREKTGFRDFIPLTVSDDGKKMYGYVEKDGEWLLYSFCGGEKKKILSLKDETALEAGFANADGSQFVAVTDSGETYLSVNYGEKIRISDSPAYPDSGMLSGRYCGVKDFRKTVFWSPNEGDAGTCTLFFPDRDGKLTVLTKDASAWANVRGKKALLYTDPKGDLYSVPLSDPDEKEKLGVNTETILSVSEGKYLYTLDKDGAVRLIGNGGSAILAEDAVQVCAGENGLYVLQCVGERTDGDTACDLWFFRGTKGEKIASGVCGFAAFGDTAAYAVTGDSAGGLMDIYRGNGRGKTEKIAENVRSFTVMRG